MNQTIFLQVLIVGTVVIFLAISYFLKKDFLDKILLYTTIFGSVFFTAFGILSKEVDNSSYIMYYILFLICLNGTVIYCIGTRPSTKEKGGRIAQIIKANEKLFNALGVIALLLQLSMLIYPEFKIMNLFSFGGYAFDPNHFRNKIALDSNTLYRIIAALRVASTPFFFIWLYNIRKDRLKVILIYLFYEYISYVDDFYIGRSEIISICVFLWIFLYEENVLSRKVLMGSIIPAGIIMIVMTSALFNIRTNKDVSESITSFSESIKSIIEQETNTQQYLDVCNSAAEELSFGKMFISIIQAPIMFLPDVDFPVLSYEFTERLLGMEYGDDNYYIVLPCAYGEGVMVLGKGLSWLYGLFIGVFISIVYRILRKAPQFKFWLIFLLIEYVKAFRGGIQTFVIYVWNSSFVLIILLTFLSITSRKKSIEDETAKNINE